MPLDDIPQRPKIETINGRRVMTPLRQGDVLLVFVEELPNDASPVLPTERGGRLRHVIAEGEASGHAHTLVADHRAGLYGTPRPELELAIGYLTVRGRGVVLEHEEHDDLPVPAS
jgi:hypothetical protein